MGKELRITVNTDQEDSSNSGSITSLREAIIQANEAASDRKVFIDFRRSSSTLIFGSNVVGKII